MTTTAITIDNVENLDKLVPHELTDSLYERHVPAPTEGFTRVCMVIVEKAEVLEYLLENIHSYASEIPRAATYVRDGLYTPKDFIQETTTYAEWTNRNIQAYAAVANCPAARFYMVP